MLVLDVKIIDYIFKSISISIILKASLYYANVLGFREPINDVMVKYIQSKFRC